MLPPVLIPIITIVMKCMIVPELLTADNPSGPIYLPAMIMSIMPYTD